MDFMKKILDKNKKMNDELAKLKAEMQAESKVLMKEAFDEFFEKYADVVENIHWTAYTPFFNDGESCTFGVHEIYVDLLGDEDSDDGDEGSVIYSESDLESARVDLVTVLDWEKDKLNYTKRHREDFITKYSRDPFEQQSIYAREYNAKSIESRMLEWKPVRGINDSTEAQNKINEIENFLKKNPNLDKDIDDMQKFISSIDDDLMETIFGDHVKVIVTKSGIEVEEYDHD